MLQSKRCKVVYASKAGAKLDSNVYNGGGTDDTEILQQILDEAPVCGGIHLILDGAALTTGLRVHSNTTIECPNKDCGLFLADNCNRAIMRNADWDFYTIKNRNIRILGGTYNHNNRHQVHHIDVDKDWQFCHLFEVFGGIKGVMCLEFYGVENLEISDVTVRDQRVFAIMVANWRHVEMTNIHIDLVNHQDYQNQDGIHLWGPGRFLTMRNIRGRSGDDFIGIAPDEHDLKSSIEDVEIDGVFLDRADQGIRLLSRRDGRLDRVFIKNVTGTYRSFGFYINPWFADGNMGSFGNIVFENIDLRPLEPNYTYTSPFLFRLGGNIESITFRNIYNHELKDGRILFDIGKPYDGPPYTGRCVPPKMGSILFDGLHIHKAPDDKGPSIFINCAVDNVTVRNVELLRGADDTTEGSLLQTGENADIGTLSAYNICVDGRDKPLDTDNGKLKASFTNNIFNAR